MASRGNPCMWVHVTCMCVCMYMGMFTQEREKAVTELEWMMLNCFSPTPMEVGYSYPVNLSGYGYINQNIQTQNDWKMLKIKLIYRVVFFFEGL